MRWLCLALLLLASPAYAQMAQEFPQGSLPDGKGNWWTGPGGEGAPAVTMYCSLGDGTGHRVPCPGLSQTHSQPNETNTTIGTSSTLFGTPGTYHSVTVQSQGQPMCVTFGTGTPTPPSTIGVCAVGVYLNGTSLTYAGAAVPNSQGKAAAFATGGSIWWSVQ